MQQLQQQKLKDHPLILKYAKVDEELYELVKATNPVLCMMIGLSKKLQEE